MKLAFSNIAWPADADDDVASMLLRNGINAIEVAPTKLLAKPAEATLEECRAARKRWNDRGIEIVAAQALLFGRPDLKVFESSENRQQTLTYLRSIISVCAELGAHKLVFGSPKARLVGSLAAEEIAAIEFEFFSRLADAAERAGSAVLMEANPVGYGCDYCTHAIEALKLVKRIGRPGFGFHMDSGCMAMNAETPDSVLPEGAAWLRHFHASEPQLAAVGCGTTGHLLCGKALRDVNYQEYVSIEMRQPEPFAVETLEAAVNFVQRSYCI